MITVNNKMLIVDMLVKKRKVVVLNMEAIEDIHEFLLKRRFQYKEEDTIIYSLYNFCFYYNRDDANYRLRGDWYRGELIFEQKD